MLAAGGNSCGPIAQIKRGAKHQVHRPGGRSQGFAEGSARRLTPTSIYVAPWMKLNENGYIVPGLGDAGDRIFGTKYF